MRKDLADLSLFISQNHPVLTLKDLQPEGWQRESMLVELLPWDSHAAYKHNITSLKNSLQWVLTQHFLKEKMKTKKCEVTHSRSYSQCEPGLSSLVCSVGNLQSLHFRCVSVDGWHSPLPYCKPGLMPLIHTARWTRHCHYAFSPRTCDHRQITSLLSISWPWKWGWIFQLMGLLWGDLVKHLAQFLASGRCSANVCSHSYPHPSPTWVSTLSPFVFFFLHLCLL